MTRAVLIALALLASGCGIKGDLATPPPVFGEDAPATDTAAEPIIDVDDQDDDPEPFYGPDIDSDYGEDD